MVDVRIAKVNDIANFTGFETAIVRAFIGLSKPVRASIRLSLVQIKQTLQGKLSTAGLKLSIIKRKRTEIDRVQGALQTKLSLTKRALSVLQVGPDFRENAAFQEIMSLLLSNVKVKGVSIGGYRDLDNAINVADFNARQVLRAVNLAELTSIALNAKVDEVDKYIQLLDAVDNL
jgi:hypothetical protein